MASAMPGAMPDWAERVGCLPPARAAETTIIQNARGGATAGYARTLCCTWLWNLDPIAAAAATLGTDILCKTAATVAARCQHG
mmetsp:Transcript_71505/g.99339  ORF Transcript_71505/g.99339 Transcript_71505/m.99339 type:complete len:83 (+) Transcript_71505:251-499(+)